MQQNAEEKQMQDSGRGGVLRAARRCCDWFAYCFDVCLLLISVYERLLKRDRSRLLLIRNVI
jgi:hypothetical protein